MPIEGAQDGLLTDFGIAGSVVLNSSDSGHTLTASAAGFPEITVAEFFGPIKPLRLESGPILLVRRDPCDGLAGLDLLDRSQIAALFFHAKGIEELNKNEFVQSAKSLRRSAGLWPDLKQLKFDWVLTRMLAGDVEGALRAAKGLGTPSGLVRVAKPVAELCW